MLLAFIAGYLVSALFAFCGVVSTAYVFMNAEKGVGSQAFFSELALAAWPLAVSAVVYLLTRILYILAQQQIMQQDAKTVVSTNHPVKKQQPHPQGAYFKTPPIPPVHTPSIQEAKALALAAAHEEEDEDDDAIKVSIPNSPPRQTPHRQSPDNELNFFRVE